MADEQPGSEQHTLTPSGQPGQEPKLEISGSRQLASWMLEQKTSFLFTTYQSGKFFLIGLNNEGKLSVFERTFNRAMGLYVKDRQTLYLSSLYQLWRMENTLQEGQAYQDYDALYVPQVGYTTGDIDVHDIAIDKDGKPIFINTLFSCLATVDEQYSFTPLWKPPFIEKLAAQDSCHLNGLAMEEGEPAFVTAISTTDVHEGWREHRQDGGVVIDVKTDKIVLEGLSMPHSPRIYQDKLYLIDSGNGYLGSVDLKKLRKGKGEFEPLTFLPGYGRGLAFINNFALVGLSKPRDNKSFSDLKVNDLLEEKNVSPRCGIVVIDLTTGDIVHSINIEGVVEEIYDVAVLPGVQRPMALGFKTEEIRRTITVGNGKL